MTLTALSPCECVAPDPCGDGVCDPAIGEDQCTCPQDCGTPPATEVPNLTCQDGLDNDCDQLADCDDPDCATDPACIQVCEPTPDLTGCEPIVCPDPTETCIPSIVSRVPGQQVFPPGGVDILTPTTGIIVLESPLGTTEAYDIDPGAASNITRVIRSDPIDAGGSG